MSKLHYDVDANGVTVVEYEGEGWSDEDKKVLQEERFNVADVPAELTTNDEPKSLAAYGLSKVLQERPSQIKGSAEKLAAMRESFEVLKGGKWREYKEGGGSRGPKLDAIFVQAVADEKKVKVPQAEAALRKMDKDTIKQIRNLPAIQARMEKLRASAEEGDVDLGFDLPDAG